MQKPANLHLFRAVAAPIRKFLQICIFFWRSSAFRDLAAEMDVFLQEFPISGR
ncbi:hypothetical protein [Paenibacillus faecis]|uniref:hypothetical protein n=1 Tax=Paenibacillus faecis TaxID=862114 RepID=UPI001BCBEF53|nr:hypothetical protein [Paenibacillus faecis]